MLLECEIFYPAETDLGDSLSRFLRDFGVDIIAHWNRPFELQSVSFLIRSPIAAEFIKALVFTAFGTCIYQIDVRNFEVPYEF